MLFMHKCFISIGRDTALLLPPGRREWVTAGHLAHFVLDAVETKTIGTGGFSVLKPASGPVQAHP